MGSSEMSGAWHDEKLWMKLAVALQWIHESNIKIIRMRRIILLVSINSWSEMIISRCFFCWVLDFLWRPSCALPHLLWRHFLLFLFLFLLILWIRNAVPQWLNKTTHDSTSASLYDSHPLPSSWKLPRLLVWRLIQSLSLAQRLARLDTKGLKYHPHGSNDAATTFDRNKSPVGRRQENSLGPAEMSPKCCRLLHDNCLLWDLNVYIFFKKWVDLCLSQTSCGTVVLHLAACKNGEGSFLKEVASLAYHLDRAEQGTSRHQWHGSQLRSAHYVGKMPSGERLFFSMLSMLTHIRSLHADW